MTTRFTDHLLTGDHASRPAFGDVPQGTLYACSDHDLIYQSDGSTAWSTWADISGTGLTNPMTSTGDFITSTDGSGTPGRLALPPLGGWVGRINGAASTITAGTSFPGSVVTGDRFRRTDIRGGMDFRYDGTRWVSDQMLEWLGSVAAITATNARIFFPLPTDYQVWIESWDTSMFISGTGVWVTTLESTDFELDFASVATKSSSGQTASKMYHYHDAIGAAVDGTGGNVANALVAMSLTFVESSGTATFYGAATVFYRLIAT